MIVLLLACTPKPAEPAAAIDPVPARADGPIAGPRAIVEEPPPPPPPPETPGGGPMQPYVVQVRKVVGDALQQCLGAEAASPPEAALVSVKVATDGHLLDLVLDRSSGAEAYDQCVLRSFRGTVLPIPPPVLVREDGMVTMPQMAFR